MSGRYNTGDDDNLAKQVAELRKRVAYLEAGNRIGATTIDRGTLSVSSGGSIEVMRPLDNAVIARIGDLSGNLWGISVYNPNPEAPTSNPLLQVGASSPDDIFSSGLVNIIDYNGDYIFTLGYPFGLGKPYGTQNFVASSSITTPSQSTTSGSFVSLWTSYGLTMHPQIIIYYVVQNDVGTTSEIRMRDAFNSNPTTIAVAWGSGAYAISAVSYEHQSPVTPGDPFTGMLYQADLEVRRTSGAGTVRVQVLTALGAG